ncbi:MAG TPA: FkbM family methyltransferase [Verrucomicrobiae bacterium]|nr:FkbM family methyltransferase [Verrucomicrobiae bacterium]
MAENILRILAQKAGNARSRMIAFSPLGVSLPSRMRWAAIGALHNRLMAPTWSALLKSWHEFAVPGKAGKRLSVRFRHFDDFITFEAVFLWRHYPLDIVDFEPDVVVDCGAHVGFFTCLAGVTFPSARIVSLEPNPDNYDRLASHVSENGIAAELVPAAAALEEGWAYFSGNSFRGALVENGVRDSIRVRTVDLNDLVGRQRAGRLIVKMDVEGAEHQLLPRLMPILPERSAIFLEWHGNRESWRGALDMLSREGFTTSVMLDETTATSGEGIVAAVRRPKGAGKADPR